MKYKKLVLMRLKLIAVQLSTIMTWMRKPREMKSWVDVFGRLGSILDEFCNDFFGFGSGLVSGNGEFSLNGLPNGDRGNRGEPMGIPDKIPDGDRDGYGDWYGYRFRGRGH
ncbi:hypothetical protein OSB04_005480 [Centaurea solstitialis]|uniref:Glycine-rich protein n=1 Tax=Centaurea solstitialis TaxID=347529 RepID=A0AA38TSS2_9ASTR|nr:hypothetical protein OSB04_005480 [Centaurea solstitialis]